VEGRVIGFRCPEEVPPWELEYVEAEVYAAAAGVRHWFSDHVKPVGMPTPVTVYYFARSDDARREVSRHFGVTEEAVPETFFGTVDGDTLFLVSDEIYRSLYTLLYPDYAWEPLEYRKAIAHELAHRIHEQLAVELSGSAEGMGPGWFFEGLAMLAAGQFEDHQESPPWDEIARMIVLEEQGELPPPTYPAYARIVRSLARRVPVLWMVKNAGGQDFLDGLKLKYLEE
jgi:hypothetical protein